MTEYALNKCIMVYKYRFNKLNYQIKKSTMYRSIINSKKVNFFSNERSPPSTNAQKVILYKVEAFVNKETSPNISLEFKQDGFTCTNNTIRGLQFIMFPSSKKNESKLENSLLDPIFEFSTEMRIDFSLNTIGKTYLFICDKLSEFIEFVESSDPNIIVK